MGFVNKFARSISFILLQNTSYYFRVLWIYLGRTKYRVAG